MIEVDCYERPDSKLFRVGETVTYTDGRGQQCLVRIEKIEVQGAQSYRWFGLLAYPRATVRLPDGEELVVGFPSLRPVAA